MIDGNAVKAHVMHWGHKVQMSKRLLRSPCVADADIIFFRHHVGHWPTFIVAVVRPHRSTTYVDAAYCYRGSSVVCLSVCRDREPCKNG